MKYIHIYIYIQRFEICKKIENKVDENRFKNKIGRPSKSRLNHFNQYLVHKQTPFQERFRTTIEWPHLSVIVR